MKKLCLMLAFMLLLFFVFPVLADDDESYLGTWYGYKDGIPMSWRFEKNGVAYIQPLGFSKEFKQKYTKKGNIIRSKWFKSEFEFQIEEDRLTIDRTKYYGDAMPLGVFTREPFDIVLPSKEKITADSPEQFSGIWKTRYLVWWDEPCLYDMEHRGTCSFESYFGVYLYYVRIDVDNSQIEFLNADKEVKFTHTFVWKDGYYYDSNPDYKDYFYLMSDGSLMKDSRNGRDSSIYYYKESE